MTFYAAVVMKVRKYKKLHLPFVGKKS